MANEIQAQTTTGKTLYAVIVNSVGQIYNGTTFVTIAAVDWANYDYPLTEATAGLSLAVMQLSLQTANDAKSAEARHNEMLRMMSQAEQRHSQLMEHFIEALQAIRGVRA